MRFVTLKSEEQLDMQTLHRVRDRAVGERTSLMNQLRAVLLERGVIVPQGRAKLRLRVTELLRRGGGLDERMQHSTPIRSRGERDEAARRLTSVPGIGALNATALVAVATKRVRVVVRAASRMMGRFCSIVGTCAFRRSFK